NGAFDKGESALAKLAGNGDAQILRGDFFRVPVLNQILQNAGGLRGVSTVGEAATTFSVADRAVTLKDTAVNSPLVGIQGGGKIGFDGKLELQVIVAPLADWKDKIRDTK